MSAIGVGDWVECIATHGTPGITLGSIYRIARVWRGCEPCDCESTEGASLDGVPDPGDLHEYVWCLRCKLRPIYRPKSEIIEALKAPSPEMEDAL